MRNLDPRQGQDAEYFALRPFKLFRSLFPNIYADIFLGVSKDLVQGVRDDIAESMVVLWAGHEGKTVRGVAAHYKDALPRHSGLLYAWHSQRDNHSLLQLAGEPVLPGYEEMVTGSRSPSFEQRQVIDAMLVWFSSDYAQAMFALVEKQAEAHSREQRLIKKAAIKND